MTSRLWIIVFLIALSLLCIAAAKNVEIQQSTLFNQQQERRKLERDLASQPVWVEASSVYNDIIQDAAF